MSDDVNRYEAYEGDMLGWTLRDRVAKIERIASEMPDLFARPDNRMAIKGLQQELKEIELNAELLAGYEVDENKKPKYTNAGQRKAAASATIKEDANYQEKLQTLMDLKSEQHDLDVDKQVMEGELNILKITIPALTKLFERETLILKIKETKDAK
jgi:hypothetical protein